MFRNAIAATTVALAGTALAQSVGNAVVVNKCSYPVYLANTPAAGGGYSAISQTLNTGDTYSQQYTELSNSQGWSLKLSKNEGLFQTDVMQYEYTWHGFSGQWGGVIWFDLSDVNGNPWDKNWELTATGACTPRQAAYQYSTDDAYGMQSCPASSDITVTLCSGETGGASGSDSSESSSESETESTPAPETTSVSEPAPATTSAPSNPLGNGFSQEGSGSPLEESNQRFNGGNNNIKNNKGGNKPQTTFATVVSSAADRGGVTVTEVATQVVTNFVTATAAAPNKRHEHVARHAHHHHF